MDVVGVARIRRLLIAAALLAAAAAAPAMAEAPAPTAGVEVPPKVRELLNLLADPGVQRWLDQNRAAGPAEPAAAPATTAASPGGMMAERLDALRQSFAALVAALPELPNELERAG